MPFEFRYFPEYNIVYERLFGSVTLDDVTEIQRQFLAQSAEFPADVTLLVDLRSVDRYPMSINQLRQALNVIRNPRIDWVVIVINDNPIMKLAAAVLTQIGVRNARFRLFEDSHTALAFIEGLDGQSRQALPLSDELRALLH